MPVTKQQALDYHFGTRPEKLKSLPPSLPHATDLSLAYTPGVAVPAWRSRTTRRTHSNTPTAATWSR